MIRIPSLAPICFPTHRWRKRLRHRRSMRGMIRASGRCGNPGVAEISDMVEKVEFEPVCLHGPNELGETLRGGWLDEV